VIEAVVAGGLMLLSAGGLVAHIRHRRELRREWAAALAACGAEVKASSGRRLRVAASLPPFELTIQYWGTTKFHRWDPSGRFPPNSPRPMVVVDGIPDGLGLTLEGEGLHKGPSDKELAIGDPKFDAAVYVQGPPALVRAVLDTATRQALVGALDQSLVVEAGRVRLLPMFLAPDAATGQRPTMAEAVALALEWARRLSWPEDAAVKLAANAREEAIPEVRLWNLLTLSREYPEDPATAAALRAALTDSDPEIRLRAAMMLGPEATEILLGMARDEKGDDERAALAIGVLDQRLGLEEVHALLNRALRARRLRTARACIAHVGRRAGPEALPVLARILAIEKGDLAEAAALALGSSGLATAEAALVAALGHERDFVRVAAAQALGRVGSLAAVIPLKQMEAHHHPSEVEVRRAAREAVAAIQERMGGGSPGQLSLVGGEAGQVSLSGDEAGRVSLP
jgi:hypothetical protein